MASRNIANMHLFLEMKTKFPYLPEDTLRNYVFLYAQDQAKCLSLLQQESENHFHHSHQFSDFRPTETKTDYKLNKNAEELLNSIPNAVKLNIPPEPNTSMAPNNLNILDSELHHLSNSNSSSARTNRSTNVIHLSTKSTNSANLPEQESHSAPILDDTERPFVDMFTSVPASSHNIFKQIPQDPSYHNRMMFSTTKEHIIEPANTSDNNFSQNSTNSSETDSPKKHAVKLSITPMLPYQQQQMNVYNNTVCASASHSSRPGRHTTSVNFQLRPQYSDQLPLEISSVPTGLGKPCNFRDFGSHVQISVGAQGATFTALRLQRPPTAQNPNIDYSSNKVSFGKDYQDHSQSSSQNLNSKFDKFPNSSKSVKIPLINIKSHPDFLKQNKNVSVSSSNEHGYSKDYNLLFDLNCKKELRDPSLHGYQTTPDYIQAVKNHQRSQLQVVHEELDKANSTFSKLKSEVNKMEFELLRRKENSISSSYGEAIKKLREENRRLRLECNCLLLEYDMISKGEIPVGVTDEDFYSNIFTGPNDGLALYSHSGLYTLEQTYYLYLQKNYCHKSSKKENPIKAEQVSDDDDDEKNSWRCKKCTFVNHPALEKCEICEISKNSGYVEFKTNYSTSSHIQLSSPSQQQQPKRAVGSVQISVTRRVPTYSKSVKLHLTHRMPR